MDLAPPSCEPLRDESSIVLKENTWPSPSSHSEDVAEDLRLALEMDEGLPEVQAPHGTSLDERTPSDPVIFRP